MIDLTPKYLEILNPAQPQKAGWGSGKPPVQDRNAFTSQVVDMILKEAVIARASDIHCETELDHVRVRFRVDGRLYEVLKIKHSDAIVVIPRLCVMAGIQREGAKKSALDGRFQLQFGTSTCDFRVATFPTVHGDKMAIRLLNDEMSKYSLEKVFMEVADYKKVQRVISHKNGLILITGPTGSGKTTTLYAILNALNAPHVNVVTLEDPVEYQIAGINQCDIRAGSNFSFAEGLHAILRQDPNVIFVGEMRDRDASEIAMRASMTGHLVISTVHSNSSVGTLMRLVDMGLEPYMVSYSLAGIIAQRLIRRICPKCKVSYSVTEADLKKYRINPEVFTTPLSSEDKTVQYGQAEGEEAPATTGVTLFKGRGCSYCNGTGFFGRVALFEILIPDDEIRDAIIKGATHSVLSDLAVKKGMRPIAYDGLLKVRLGITSLDEVMEVLFEKVV